MSRRLILAIFTLAPLAVLADNIHKFQVIADQGPIEDDICRHYGGANFPVTDEEVKTIIRNARNVDKKLYYKGHVYIMYASRASDGLKSQIVPTYNLTLCRF